eukprot:CAMPEP_0174373132 /NCGR_PEP_ID=MMETSP0811_2-20130205/105926_1 /TAXON_ID=73025 ORGANISM="Eutreptiella gymnastica-like, Strain CCMP1594" /NCGR_SAMPLE_ID=MMETSP0811_2 /ASSEMBLY_ACC=CAM_ASM_000667 /LENGTH=46 /DNA_ID= /DNA_START= /DNA_END= /DNA_ORIENTATION=
MTNGQCCGRFLARVKATGSGWPREEGRHKALVQRNPPTDAEDELRV